MECKSSVRRNLHEGRSLNVRARKLARRCERANTERVSGVGCRRVVKSENGRRVLFARVGSRDSTLLLCDEGVGGFRLFFVFFFFLL